MAEGGVGAGTGMIAYELKGGIGTASRVVPATAGGYTVGVLVNANQGLLSELTVATRRVCRTFRQPQCAARSCSRIRT